MELTVYRQSSKQRPDGQIIYKGEDARPFVGKNLLFVADGLGGASAIRHQKFKQELFDTDKILSVLFNDIPSYNDEILSACEEYKKYVVDSFSEFTSIKDCYFDNVYNIKKSGYFASRIVAAIFLHDVLFDKHFPQSNWSVEDGALFDRYNQAENKQDFLENISKYITQKVKSELKKIAENANLIYESSYSGLALLGTTLCATIFYEREDYVEALYFVAGDSRPYMWNSQGLFQVVEDQEGQDGGMTNYIKANEDGDFKIECKYLKVNKPCMLFNASDGCFDSKYFISQMAFEKLILETIVAQNDLIGVANSLENTFLEYGKHDDSSTMAMKFFGYENYEAIRKAAIDRLKVLNEKYFESFPNLLEEDFATKVAEFKAECPDELKELKKSLIGLQSVKEYCCESLKKGVFDVYNLRVASIDSKLAIQKNKFQEIYPKMEELVQQNYLYFAKWLKMEDAYKYKDFEKAEELMGLYSKSLEGYKTMVEENKGVITKINELLMGEIENLPDVETEDVQSFDKIDLEKVIDCKIHLSNIQRFLDELKRNENHFIKRAKEYRFAYYEKNKNCAKHHPNEVKEIIKLFLDGKVDLSNIGIFDFDKKPIEEVLEKLTNIVSLIKDTEIREKNALMMELYPIYWDRNYLSIMKNAVSLKVPDIGAKYEAEVKAVLTAFDEKLVSIESVCQKQKAIFDEYDANYYSLIRGN